MEEQYLFEGGDGCAECAALSGTINDQPLAPVHPNCKCKDILMSGGCPTIEFEDPQIDSADGLFNIIGHVTVTCCDGTTRQGGISLYTPIYHGLDAALEAFDTEIQEMADSLIDDDCSKEWLCC